MKSPIEYIKEAWRIYIKKENFLFFAKIMAVLVILSSVLSFIIGYFYPADYLKNGDYSNIPMLVGFVAISLVAFIISLWVQTTTYFAILKIGDDEKVVFKTGFHYMWKFFLVSLVIGIIILFGVILLIIPAIIFGVWYSFSVFLVLDKNMSIRESLKVSKQMVSGKFWKVFGRFVVFGLFTIVISILLSLIPYAGSLAIAFIAPLFTLPFYLLYKDLSAGGRLDDLGTV